MLTGLLPPQHGVRENGLFRLADSFDTVPELLGASVESAAFVAAFPLVSRFGLAQGFDRYDDELGRASKPGRTPERRADEVFDAAAAWLDGTGIAKAFAFVHAYDPHYPYAPPPPWPAFARDPTMTGSYETEIAFTDRELGRFLRRFDGPDAGRTATILLTSDHGESLGSHKEITHSLFVYDGTQRVPMILVGPRVAPSLETRQRTLADVAPTILDAFGVEPPAAWRGAPLTKPPREQEAYVETMSPELVRGWSSLYGVRTPRWKYIRAPRRELYSLPDDPAESRNRIEDDEEAARELETTLAAILATAAPAVEPEADEETLAALRSLGYVATVTPGATPATRKDPKDGIDGVAALFHGEQAYRDGDLPRAEVILRRALQLDPRNKDAYSHLAGTYYGLGRFGLSIEYSRRALELEPHWNEGPIHMTLGEAYLALDRPHDAVAPLAEAVRLMPGSEKARGLLARARASAG